ncbi:MAG: long-chain fatty acid--CoA ligase [Rhodobacteraceae bacterium]|nr:long-chain fatty acid--CoA ligase [Paracoccaceae bacterium]
MQSIPAYLRHNAKRLGDAPAFREKEFGVWQTWTWSQVEKIVTDFALGLMEIGVKEGDFVAIIGRNRPALYWSMMSAQMVGAIPVPLYQDAVAEEMGYVLGHCGARFVIADDQEQVDKVLEIQGNLPDLQEMIYIDPRGLRKYDHSKLHDFKKMQETGSLASEEAKAELERRIAELNFDTVCVMLYTSGTTGRPKGVVLSNRNIVISSLNSCKFDNLTDKEEILSYLPIAWVGDFIFSFGQAAVVGLRVNCPESRETVSADLREIGPSYYFAPPRIFEAMLTAVVLRIEDTGAFKQRLYKYFMDHASKVGGPLLDGKSVGFWDRLKYRLGEFCIYAPLKNTLGLSRVRVGYTAGEAIGPEIFDFFRSLGINLKQLYGQTEASVFITVQPDGEVRSDTVGIPAPDTEVRIGENGEVYYRSPGAFVEYYKNPESTAETKDGEGWVATGDAGFIEEGTGHLRIIDRAKDVGKLSNGAMFAPKYVENKLKFFPNILEAVVFGAGRDHCVAFINIDLNAVGNWAERNNIAYSSYQELSGHPKVLDMVQEHVEIVNRSVAEDAMLAGCQIHRFLVLHKELDADDGEMTRTRKVRRKIIGEKFGDLVSALYDGSQQIYTETEVTYEDGRKGKITATLEIRDAALANANSALAAE